MYAGGPWNQSAFLRGGKGGTPIHGNNPVESNRFQTWKNKCRAMVRRQVKRSLTQLGGDRVSVCVKVSGDRLS